MLSHLLEPVVFGSGGWKDLLAVAKEAGHWMRTVRGLLGEVTIRGRRHIEGCPCEWKWAHRVRNTWYKQLQWEPLEQLMVLVSCEPGVPLGSWAPMGQFFCLPETWGWELDHWPVVSLFPGCVDFVGCGDSVWSPGCVGEH